MKKSIGTIKLSILKLEAKLHGIQEACRHKRVEKKHCGDTGNYDPSNDRYWTEFKCLDCDKYWEEEGSK